MKQCIVKKCYKSSQELVNRFEGLIGMNEIHQCSTLTKLHLLLEDIPILSKETDQNTFYHVICHREFDLGLDSTLVLAYRNLCNEWLVDLRNIYQIHDWAIQRYPSIRVQFPGNISVYEFHRDSTYNHLLGEINHFLAITDCNSPACLYVEQHLGWADYKPLELHSGQSAILNTSIYEHGDIPNSESTTRISIDFRAIPRDVLLNNSAFNAKSPTKEKSFSLQDYFIDSNLLLDE